MYLTLPAALPIRQPQGAVRIQEGSPRSAGLLDFIVGQTSRLGRRPEQRARELTPYGILCGGVTSTVRIFSGVAQSQTIAMHVGLRSPYDSGVMGIANFTAGYGQSWKLCTNWGPGLRFTFSGVADYSLGYSLPSDGRIVRLGIVIARWSITVYENGVQVSQIGCGTMGAMSNPAVLTTNWAIDENTSAHIVDNVLLWGRELSASEMLDDAKNPFAPLARDPIRTYFDLSQSAYREAERPKAPVAPAIITQPRTPKQPQGQLYVRDAYADAVVCAKVFNGWFQDTNAVVLPISDTPNTPRWHGRTFSQQSGGTYPTYVFRGLSAIGYGWYQASSGFTWVEGWRHHFGDYDNPLKGYKMTVIAGVAEWPGISSGLGLTFGGYGYSYFGCDPASGGCSLQLSASNAAGPFAIGTGTRGKKSGSHYGATWRGGTDIGMAIDGVRPPDFATSGAGVSDHSDYGTDIRWFPNGNYLPGVALITFFAILRRGVCDAELSALTEAPYSLLFRAPRSVRYFDLARAKGTMRPTVMV